MADVGVFWPFGIFWGYLGYFVGIWDILCMVIWYIFLRFGMLCKEKSVNPGRERPV
jgi:hypothetical protein